MPRPKPVFLVILDGWGMSDRAPTAMSEANTKNFERLMKQHPSTTLGASGEDVGLMPGQMGDSNVGHLNIGAGRIVYQDLVRIFKDIEGGGFFKNQALLGAVQNAKNKSSALHLMGLLSDGGVHSHEKHLYALLELAKTQGLDKVYIHAFLDGRDVPPKSAIAYLESLERKIQDLKTGEIASITGRYYAMDRDRRWDRTRATYHMLTGTGGLTCENWREALKKAYEEGVTDEFVAPTLIRGKRSSEPRIITTGDSVVFFNFRADRARQISHAFCDPEFRAFPRGSYPKTYFVGMLRYEEGLSARFAYLPLILKNTLGEVVSDAGLSQLRLAETEKYAHVTFFFSGKREKPFPGEDRKLVPSPKVPTYDEKPEMSAYEITREALKHIKSGQHDFVVVNYANPDMVGHTGCYVAAKKAVEVVDECLGQLVHCLLDEGETEGGAALIIADHGNVEDLPKFLGTGQPHTYHTSNKVPCILVVAGNRIQGRKVKGLRPGILADVAPTILEVMGLRKPAEMDGDSLIVF